MSPREHDLAAGPRLPEHLVGSDHAPVHERHRFTVLERAALPAGGNAERVGGLDVEATGAQLLHQRVADRIASVTCGERAQLVALARQHGVRRELDDGDLEREPAEDPAQRLEELVEAARPVQRQRQLAAAQGEGLEHPGQTEEVVGVKVGQEDLLQVDEAEIGAQQLPLRPLAAVDQQPLPAPP